MADETAISIQSAHEALQSLEESLSDAYENARSQEVRDLLDDRLDIVEELLTELNRAAIHSRSIALSAAADSTAEALKRLDSLKARIKAISDHVGKAAEVIEDVDKVLSGVKEYFGI